MNFIREKVKDFYLLDSSIENLFINEYLPQAPGDFVKAYIFGSMYAQFGLDISTELMAKQLGMSQERIAEAWKYWEDAGVLKRMYLGSDGGYTIEFLNLKEMMYGQSTEAIGEAQDKRNLYGDETIKKTFNQIEKIVARTLSSTETTQVLSWMVDENISPEVVIFGVNYCVNLNKPGIRYIDSVLKGWKREGLGTVDQVKSRLEETDARFLQYRRVLKALGLTRNATEAEMELMDSWFDDMGFNLERVIDACSKTVNIPNPNLNYVNKVLVNWKNEAEEQGVSANQRVVVTQGMMRQYYDHLKRTAEQAAEERREEVYEKVPGVKEIDRKLESLGTELSKALITKAAPEVQEEIRSSMDQLEADRAFYMAEANYEIDYTDIKYRCEKCHDTGITELGEQCDCRQGLMEEAEQWFREKEDAR